MRIYGQESEYILWFDWTETQTHDLPHSRWAH